MYVLASHLTFFKLHEWKNKKTNPVYRICKTILSLSFWLKPHANQNSVWYMAIFKYLGVKQLTLWFGDPNPFFQSRHYHAAFLPRILSIHMLPLIISTTFSLTDQNQLDLGIFSFPNEIEMQYLTLLGVCRYCLVHSI